MTKKQLQYYAAGFAAFLLVTAFAVTTIAWMAVHQPKRKPLECVEYGHDSTICFQGNKVVEVRR